jgi:hypothetical protein
MTLGSIVYQQAAPPIPTQSLCNLRQRPKVMRDTSEVL